MKKKRKLGKKLLSFVLTLVMVFSTMTGIVPFMDTSMTVKAEVADKTVAGLGTSAIINPTSTESSAAAWAGNYVYYGKYDGTSPTKYRVLDRASSDFDVAGGSLLLDCDTTLYNAKFHDDKNNTWSSSSLKSGLQGTAFLNKLGVFTEQEKGAIASSTKSTYAQNDGSGDEKDHIYAALSADTVFVLDGKEASRASYGYASNGTRKKSGTANLQNSWWMRSSTKVPSLAGFVYGGDGIFYNYGGGKEIGVCPAFNINLSSVIFSSIITGTAGEAGAEYKLTLLDDKMSIALTSGQKVAKSGDTLTIPYTVSGDNSGNVTQVSVLVTDKAYTESDAKVVKYGKLAGVDSSSLSGTGTFELPSELTGTLGTDYHIYLLAEDVKGKMETDYANLKEITVDDISSKSAQTVTPPTAATNLTYTGQELALLTGGATVVSGNTTGTFEYIVTPADSTSWKSGWTDVKATNAGEYKVYYRVSGNETYADFVSSDEQAISVNIAKAAPVTPTDAQKPVAKTGDDVVYTGEPIELVKAPTTDLPLDYEAIYSTDGVNWSKGIPKGTDPRTYTVNVKYVSAGNNCDDITLDDITVTITPPDKTALTDAITAAKEYYDTIKDNADYKEAADKLDKAIKEAEAVAKADKVTKSEVSTATETVTKAKATAEAEVKDIDDTKAVQAVSDKIAALPAKDEVTKEDKTAIEEARAAYNALTEAQKDKVTPEKLKKLTDAEDKLVILQVMSEVSAKTGSDMTYTGNPIQLINVPTTKLPEGYKMVYAVTTENKAPTDESAYTEAIPAKTEVGT